MPFNIEVLYIGILTKKAVIVQSPGMIEMLEDNQFVKVFILKQNEWDYIRCSRLDYSNRGDQIKYFSENK